MNQPNETLPLEGPRKWLAVYTIVERGGATNGNGNGHSESGFGGPSAKKEFFVRIGTAFVNKDQSLNVKLDAVPTNGTLHIREAQPLEERTPRRASDRAFSP